MRIEDTLTINLKHLHKLMLDDHIKKNPACLNGRISRRTKGNELPPSMAESYLSCIGVWSLEGSSYKPTCTMISNTKGIFIIFLSLRIGILEIWGGLRSRHLV